MENRIIFNYVTKLAKDLVKLVLLAKYCIKISFFVFWICLKVKMENRVIYLTFSIEYKEVCLGVLV